MVKVCQLNKLLGHHVRVKWLDHSSNSGWFSPVELLDVEPVRCVTVGWLVLVSDGWVLTASDCSEVGLNGVGLILRNCITSISDAPYGSKSDDEH